MMIVLLVALFLCVCVTPLTDDRTVNFTRVFSTMGELCIDHIISSPNEVCRISAYVQLNNALFDS